MRERAGKRLQNFNRLHGGAPARVLASVSDYVDLDVPLLLARDRENRLNYHNGKIDIPTRKLWG